MKGVIVVKRLPQISDSEWKVMNILWSKAPATSSEIIKKLSETTEWRPTTVKTLLSRLVDKKVIGFEQKKRTYYYYPLVSESECIKAESKTFLKKFYGGTLKSMLASFLEIEELSEKDIDELKQILDEKKK